MNTLSFRLSPANRLSFELWVDEYPLAQRLGSPDNTLPYKLVHHARGLPAVTWIGPGTASWEPRPDDSMQVLRAVAICNCGFTECGCTACQVAWHGDTVEFRDFRYHDPAARGCGQRYRFTLANYLQVLNAMHRLSRVAGSLSDDELADWIGE